MRLKKLKMPAGKDNPRLAAAEEELGQDLDMDEEAGEPAAHRAKVLGQEEMGEEMADDESAPAELDMVSDDDLMAEIKKRGLEKKLNEEPAYDEMDEQANS